jgi:hypothetical protein
MKKYVILISIYYLRASCLVRCYPLAKYYHKYFQHGDSKPFDFTPFRNELKLIKKVIRHMPGKNTCLKESLTVFLYFQRKGYHIPLYLGVSTQNEFMAHAWYDQDNSKGFDALELS